MPIDETALLALVDAARLSTAQLERISQTVCGTALGEMSNASTPAQQAKDLITYAGQYGLMNELAAALLYTGADRPGMQRMLLGEKMVNPTEDHDSHKLDLIRLENRVERLADKVEALAQRVETALQRAPLNWNIVAWGFVLAVVAGLVIWLAATVN